jgi:hypothetical protein
MQHLSLLGAQRRSLEDAFFLKEDEKLLQEMRTIKKMAETRESLAAVTGIRDEQVLQKLLKLDIHAETAVSFALVPLVEVAWADGDIDEKERRAVLEGAGGFGFVKGNVDYALLERWLGHRPGPELLKTWVHFMQGLCGQLTDAERLALKDDLLSRARRVAEAAGSFLGLTDPVSPQEKKMLAQLAVAFDQHA